MRAVNIVGPKKSGKTSVGLTLAKALQEKGHKVAVAKHTRHHFDKADTDTDRYREFCVGVIGVSPGESFVTWPQQRFLPDLIPLVEADVLVVEGGRELTWLPRVLCINEDDWTEGLMPELALATCGRARAEGMAHITDPAELADLVMHRGFMLPGLDCGSCGYEDCGELARRIVAGEEGLRACVATHGSMRVTVNGKPLALNTFVEQMLHAGLTGMLSTLKGYSSGKIVIDLET